MSERLTHSSWAMTTDFSWRQLPPSATDRLAHCSSPFWLCFFPISFRPPFSFAAGFFFFFCFLFGSCNVFFYFTTPLSQLSSRTSVGKGSREPTGKRARCESPGALHHFCLSAAVLRHSVSPRHHHWYSRLFSPLLPAGSLASNWGGRKREQGKK